MRLTRTIKLAKNQTKTYQKALVCHLKKKFPLVTIKSLTNSIKLSFKK